MLFLSLGFPWSFHILYYCLAVFIDNRISGVHTFNFGLALNVVFADEVRVAVSFRSSHNFNMAGSIAVSSIFSFIWRLSICVRMWAEYHSLYTLSQLIFFCYPAIILLAVDFCISMFEFDAHTDWMVIKRILWHIV